MWITIDKDNLPKGKVLAATKDFSHSHIGHIHFTVGCESGFKCSSKQKALYDVVRYIPMYDLCSLDVDVPENIIESRNERFGFYQGENLVAIGQQYVVYLSDDSFSGNTFVTIVDLDSKRVLIQDARFTKPSWVSKKDFNEFYSIIQQM